MRRLIVLLCLFAPAAFPYASFSGWCQQGGVQTTVAGQRSTQYVQQSYPNFTQSGAGPSVTVYAAGTTNKLTIYSDNNATPLSNPFPCSATGQYAFWTGSGSVTADLAFTGTGLSSFTRPGIQLTDPLSISTVSAEVYGADPTGTSDSSSAYVTAIASLPASGGTLIIGAGVFKGSISFPQYPKAVRVLCMGENSTILRPSSANAPLFSLSATVSNFSSPKIEVGNCGVQAHAAGSTGAMIVLDGMLHPYFHDLTYLSNGTGNYAVMFSQNDQGSIGGPAFGADVERITVTVQSGPTNVVTTVNNSSLNQWRNFRIVGNTGMTSVFNFSLSSSGGNIVEGLDCEGNLSAVCMYPGRNLVESSGYFEDNAGYITGNGGSSNTFAGDTFSGNHPGTGITGTDAEANWIFTNETWPTPTSPNLTSAGLYGWQICAGNICKNSQGGFISTIIDGLVVYAKTVISGGGVLSPTSCNGAGVCTYIITAVDQAGNEGIAGAQSPVTVSSGTTNGIFGQASHVTGASYYNVYGPNCPNVSHSQCGYLRSFDATFSAENGFLIDDGSLSPTTQVPPTVDHTGDITSQNGLYVPTAPNMVTDTSSSPNSIVANLKIYTGWGDSPPTGFTVYVTATAQPISAGSHLTFNLNGTMYQVNGTSNVTGTDFQCTVAAGSPLMMTYNGTGAWISPNCGANPTVAFVPSGAEIGSNNALIVNGVKIALVAGQPVQILTGHTCGSGCTIKWNGTVYNLKSGYNTANNITTTYAAGAIINATFDGTEFQDSRQ